MSLLWTSDRPSRKPCSRLCSSDLHKHHTIRQQYQRQDTELEHEERTRARSEANDRARHSGLTDQMPSTNPASVDYQVQELLLQQQQRHRAETGAEKSPSIDQQIQETLIEHQPRTGAKPEAAETRRPEAASHPEATPPTPLEEAILPTEMSCRQAFDQAWACNSLGGQFNSIYRYGSMRACSRHWDDFWFCMRTKSSAGEQKADMIRQYHRDRMVDKYGPGKPSSEDVWSSRDTLLPMGSAFSMPLDEHVVDE